MLALTETAAQAVEAVVTNADSPDDAVLRISSSEGTHDQETEARELRLELVDAPHDDDVRVAEMPISVEPETLPFLDGKVLDAEIDEGEVKFSLFLQPPEIAEEQTSSMNGSGPAAAGDDVLPR